MPTARRHEPAFDVLRTSAAAAVILIHVLGPYRERLGQIPDLDWASAVALNGLLRWSIPVFIMITGALMLSDARPLRVGYFLRRRVSKVLVPFLWWSSIYAVVAGVSLGGFDGVIVGERLMALPTHETYYHLGFFYYFIPLYLLVGPLKLFVERTPRLMVLILLSAWLMLTALYLAGQEGLWSVDIVMYGGYLLLGFVLWRFGSPPLALLIGIGAVALVLGDAAVISESFETGRYRVGRWFSYTTINTVIAAALVFTLGFRVSQRLSPRTGHAFEFIGRHSLGIYLLHPLFLWPVRAFDLYAGHPLVVIPCWALVAGTLALATSALLSRWRVTRWMVP
jgi:surface polysaccharide O-acyltransferase-like enzyme